MADRTVVCPLGVRRKETRRKLVAFSVVEDTFTAYALARTRLVTAIAVGQIRLFIAALFHDGVPLLPATLISS